MDKIKKLLLKKEKGNVGFYIVIMILFIVIIFIAVYELSFQRTVHLKTKVDNGAILSALSANVVDLYQYASTGDVAYASSTQTGSNLYIGSSGHPFTGYSNINEANKSAGRMALMRFLDSLNDNLGFIDFTRTLTLNDHANLPISPTDEFVKSAKIDQFILYNKVGGKIYKSAKDAGGKFNVTELTGNSDPSVSKADNIQNSCIYVKMTCKFYVMGSQTVDVTFDELVSISAT